MRWVVYLLIPTSNHNFDFYHNAYIKLYIFWFLHQTTTRFPSRYTAGWLYIFWFLHQTTTMPHCGSRSTRCISFDSYIKPQPFVSLGVVPRVVYLLIPTSNHNLRRVRNESWRLYIFWFLHQTTTYRFENTDFQRITFTFSNKKWWVGYIFQCKSTKKTPIE